MVPVNHIVLLSEARGEWTAHPTPWGFLVRDPLGKALRVLPTKEEAFSFALKAKEIYDEVDELVARATLSYEELYERELEESEEGDDKEPPF